ALDLHAVDGAPRPLVDGELEVVHPLGMRDPGSHADQAEQGDVRRPAEARREGPLDRVEVGVERCGHGDEQRGDNDAAAHFFTFGTDTCGTPKFPSSMLSFSMSIGPTMFTIVSSRGSAEMI